MSNKGKKKQGKVVMSLGEFHASTETSSGGGGGSGAGLVRINWADEMEKLDDTTPTEFVFDRSKLPTAAKATLAPDFDLELVPKQPPFTAYISNVSFEADEAKIRSFFRESNILTVRLPLDERGRFKGQGFIDFADRESLITALQKNEQAFFNRPMKVALESKSKQGYGSYGNNNSGERASDESDWRRQPQPSSSSENRGDFSGPLKSQSFHNDPARQGGGRYGGNRDGYRDNNRDGNRDGYQRRNNYNNQGQNAWSHNNNRESYQSGGDGQRPPRRNYQKYDGPKNRNELSREGDEPNDQAVATQVESPGAEETQGAPSVRPKLNLAPRTLPVTNEPNETLAAASSIFGSARPVNTAAREREIEEKLRREREKIAEEKAAAAAAAAAQAEESGEVKDVEEQEEVTNIEPVLSPVVETYTTGNRSHKTSVSSDHRGDTGGEFQTVGGDRHHHQQQSHGGHHGGKYRGSGGGDRRGFKNNEAPGRHQKLATSESFTASRENYHARQHHNKPRADHASSGHHHQQQERGSGATSAHIRSHDEPLAAATAPPPRSENPWKTKQSAAELFSNSTIPGGDSPQQNRGPTRTGESQGVGTDVLLSSTAPSSAGAPIQRRPNNTNNTGNRERKQGDFQNNRSRGDSNRRPAGGSYNSRGGATGNKQTANRQGSGGAEKPAYQSRGPRPDYASATASSSTANKQSDPGFINKFASLKLDVEDVDDEDDAGDDIENDDDEVDNDDQENQHRQQSVEA